MQNIHLLSYTVHVALWNLYTDHKRGGQPCDLTFSNNCKALWESWKVPCRERPCRFFSNQVKLFQHGRINSSRSFRKRCRDMWIIRSVKQRIKLLCGGLPGCSWMLWLWVNVDWCGVSRSCVKRGRGLLLNSTALQIQSQDKSNKQCTLSSQFHSLLQIVPFWSAILILKFRLYFWLRFWYH